MQRTLRSSVRMASTSSGGKLYLGLDSSTQGLKISAIDDKLNVVKSFAINYQKDLSHYKLKDGVHAKAGNVVTQPTLMVSMPPRTSCRPRVAIAAHPPACCKSIRVANYGRCTPDQFQNTPRITTRELKVYSTTTFLHFPLQYFEALDLLLSKMKAEGFAFGKVAAVSGSGQQHGSVYWKSGSKAKLNKLAGGAPLKTQLADAFRVGDSPIWMDSSTSAQCAALEKALGGPQAVADITGSRAYERFTGNQIAKIAQADPKAFAETERVSLISSAMCSVLLGDYAPIDTSDGCGMNMLDLKSFKWWVRSAVPVVVIRSAVPMHPHRGNSPTAGHHPHASSCSPPMSQSTVYAQVTSHHAVDRSGRRGEAGFNRRPGPRRRRIHFKVFPRYLWHACRLQGGCVVRR